MNPLLAKYLSEKYGPDYEKIARAEYEADKERIGNANVASTIGHALAGRDTSSSDAFYNNQRKIAKEDSVGRFDAEKKRLIDELRLDRQDEIHNYTVNEKKNKALDHDPSSTASMAFRGSIEATSPRIAATLKKMGIWDQISASHKDVVFDPAKLQEMSSLRQQSLNSSREAKDRDVERRNEERDYKKREADAVLNVPGYERSATVRPRPEEASKFRGASEKADKLTRKLKRLRELVDKKGAFEKGGKDGQEMESLATEIQLLAKSAEMYDLGVLNGPDLKLLERITANPASLDSLFTFDSTRLKQIDTQLKSIDEGLDASAKSMGYTRQAPGKVRVTNGKETLEIDASDLEDAIKDGYQPVK